MSGRSIADRMPWWGAALVLLLFALSVGAAVPAHAATFSGQAPVRPVAKAGAVTIGVDVSASAGQTLAPAALISIDGAAPINASASYVVVGYHQEYDADYDYWYDVPDYDFSRARYSISVPLEVRAYRIVVTVTESPSGEAFTYTWTIPGESCTACHDDQPLAHDMTSCWSCHTTSGPVLRHNGSCSGCHGGGHGADRLLDHYYYDMEGNPYFVPALGCTYCHRPMYPTVLQVAADHPALSPSWNTGPTAGYLSWDAAATADPANNSGSPHGGYTASTNKCAVCHSVHGATAGGSVLTAYGPFTSYAQGCVACHGDGTTFTDVKMVADADGYISPHGTCTRCHVLNPHGAAGSAYPVLAAKLLNAEADSFIASDLAAGANGLVAAMFDGTGDSATGLILGTGYLCSACHQQAFSVNIASADPVGGAAGTTGHRVTARATEAWDRSVHGASMDATTTVAWSDAYGCDACHNAPSASGTTAFPHGYVDSAGAASPMTVAGASYIWLTTASDATLNDSAILATAEPDSPVLLSEDGLCLKCHRSGTGAGVGLSY